MINPVAVYYGAHMECLFLKTALEGSGIPASIKNFSMSGGSGGDARVYVDRTDVERASPLIEHFKTHGQKSSPF